VYAPRTRQTRAPTGVMRVRRTTERAIMIADTARPREVER